MARLQTARKGLRYGTRVGSQIADSKERVKIHHRLTGKCYKHATVIWNSRILVVDSWYLAELTVVHCQDWHPQKGLSTSVGSIRGILLCYQ